MISNLPLLFVKGEPTSLIKMTANELECFITFLVQCSLGHDTVKNVEKPPWWPADVPFSDPFVRPSIVPKDWSSRLRQLVRLCYKHHCSEFLLTFCEDLSKNPPGSLHYVNHCDSTISVYLKSSRKLLFTFRNENLVYDKPDRKKPAPSNRKCLLPYKQKSTKPVIDSGINIILCDTCDRMFDSLEEVREHEKVCSQRDTVNTSPLSLEFSSSVTEAEPIIANDQDSFLRMFGLKNSSSEINSLLPARSEIVLDVRRNEGREKKTVILSSLVRFPFSSPAGLSVQKTHKHTVDTNIKREHLDKFCTTEHSRWSSKYHNRHYPVRYKKPENYWTRYQIFPYQRKKYILDLKSQLLYLQCKSVSVSLKCLTLEEIKSYTDKSNVKNNNSSEIDLSSNNFEFVSPTILSEDSSDSCASSSQEDIKQDDSEIVSEQNTAFSDVIDLCSDDESHDHSRLTPVICHPNRNSFPEGFVLATIPEFLQPLNSNTELESAQCHVNTQNDDLAESHFENINKNDHDVDPLDISANEFCLDNVISLE